MMIAGGTDVRTVASYLGHSSVSMALNIYADVDPDAKMAAVDKVEEAFDDVVGTSWRPSCKEESAESPSLTFSADQLRAMLAAAEAREIV